jgi:lysophospholipase L1-like esterase
MRLPLLLVAVLGWNILAHADDAPAPATPAAPAFPATGSALNLTFIGDSITAATYLKDEERPGAVCAAALGEKYPGVTVSQSNGGLSGFTTCNFLPSGNPDPDNKSPLNLAEKGARQLQADHPGLAVFSIMLGTNDSAQKGPTGAPVAADKYKMNLEKIAKRLLADFPGCKVVLQQPTWYSPNTENFSYYGQEGLDLLQTYFPVIAAIPADFPGGQVVAGDTAAFEAFKADPTGNLNPQKVNEKNGHHGTFYLHPNPAGATALGKFWAEGIATALAPKTP